MRNFLFILFLLVVVVKSELLRRYEGAYDSILRKDQRSQTSTNKDHDDKEISDEQPSVDKHLQDAFEKNDLGDPQGIDAKLQETFERHVRSTSDDEDDRSTGSIEFVCSIIMHPELLDDFSDCLSAFEGTAEMEAVSACKPESQSVKDTIKNLCTEPATFDEFGSCMNERLSKSKRMDYLVFIKKRKIFTKCLKQSHNTK